MLILKLILMMRLVMIKKIELLDLDKTCVTSNGVLLVCNGALWDTTNPT